MAVLAGERPWPTAGWTTSTPEAQGMDSAALERADEWLRVNVPNRYSFLVIRNGYLVYERYYNGSGRYDARHIASISKSFLSALTGIAVEQGRLSLDDKWFDTFPEYRTAVQDPRTTDLRIRQMLTMCAGLDWSDTMIPLWFQFPAAYPDWIRFTLQQPAHAAPGERFWYNTGNTHLLSAFLTRKAGMSTLEYARRNLFQPLGIIPGDWWRDPRGFYAGGFGMHITAPDVAKFGYLYLRDGMWDGRQIVPEPWVRASIAPQVRHASGTDDFYGYLWWMDVMRGFFVPSARGMGRQFIWFSKELDLLVVTTGDSSVAVSPPNPSPVMTEYIIPSLFRAAPVVADGGVVSAAGGASVIAPDSFVSIYGENFTPAEVKWDSVVLDGRTLPKTLAGVSVRVGGRDAYLSYAGPTQLNVLIPPDVEPGTAEVVVSNQAGRTTTTAVVEARSPGLFAAVPAGDSVVLYATGLGRTAGAHPIGEVLREHYAIADPASIRVLFADVEATPEAVTMTYAGLWQINVKVPSGVDAGDVQVRVRAGDRTSAPLLCQRSP